MRLCAIVIVVLLCVAAAALAQPAVPLKLARLATSACASTFKCKDCDSVTGYCVWNGNRDTCKPGSWGTSVASGRRLPDCTRACDFSVNHCGPVDSTRCDVETGVCVWQGDPRVNCAVGFWGVDEVDHYKLRCDKSCPATQHCVQPGCDYLTGGCYSDADPLHNCQPGWWGQDTDTGALRCNRQCPANCRSSCNAFTGVCNSLPVLPPSGVCLPPSPFHCAVGCDSRTQSCVFSSWDLTCQAEYYGARANPNGGLQYRCDTPCPATVRANCGVPDRCTPTTGNCFWRNGVDFRWNCKVGSWGRDATLVNGLDCESTCHADQHCAQPGCNPDNGYCFWALDGDVLHQCAPGYYGVTQIGADVFLNCRFKCDPLQFCGIPNVCLPNRGGCLPEGGCQPGKWGVSGDGQLRCNRDCVNCPTNKCDARTGDCLP